MRIAIVMGAKGWRGSVASFVKVAEGLVQRGHEAHFLTAAGPVPERLRALGHEVVELGAKKTGVREVLALHRVLRDRRIDAIYADTPRDLRLAAYATRLRASPIVYRYNVNARPPRGHLGDKLFARAVGALVVLSRWVEARVALQEPWLAARPMVRIPNGFDTELFRPDPAGGAAVRARLGLAPEIPTVLCASVFAPGKRQGFLIDALRRLRDQRSGRVACLLAGGTEAHASFGVEARASGLEIHWLGRPAPEELPGIYAAADVVAQPSDIESFGNVIGEAMACGRAVVVPDAGAAAEVAGEGAIIAPAADADRWATLIGELLAAPRRRESLGVTARQRIIQEFPLSRMQDAHIALFERLGQ